MPHALRNQVSLDARWWSASGVGSTFTFGLRGQLLLTRHLGVALTLPWTGTVGTDLFAESLGAVGNPTLDLYYAARSGIATWQIGAGASAPLASVPEVHWRFATYYAQDALAYYDEYQFGAGWVPVHAFGNVEIRPSGPITLRLGVEPVVQIPSQEDYQITPGLRIPDRELEIAIQHFADLQILAAVGVGGGLRLQAVVYPTVSDDFDSDGAQLSVEPFVAFDNRRSFFARLGLLMALDERLGFAFDTGKVATLHASLGGYLDGSGGVF